MAYITVKLDDTNLYDGQVVNFKAPCDCSVPEGLKICDKTFDFVDSMGHNILGVGGFFTKDAILSVILDVTNGKAYVQTTLDGRGIIKPSVKSNHILNGAKASTLRLSRTLGKSKQRKLTGAQLFDDSAEAFSNGATATVADTIVKVISSIEGASASYSSVNYRIDVDKDKIGSSIYLKTKNMKASGNNLPMISLRFYKEDGTEILRTDTNLSNYTKQETIPAETAYMKLFLYATFNGSCKIGDYVSYEKVMVSYADVDWEPYIGAGENLIGTDFQSSENNGITFTVNGDKSITANGTATAVAAFQMFSTLPPGKYVVSGCPAGSGCSIEHKKDNANGALLATETGTGFVTFTINEKTTVCSYIRIPSGTVCNNLVFRPRIYLETPTPAPNPKYPQPVVNVGQKIVDGWQLANLPDAGETEVNGIKWSCKNGAVTAKGRATKVSPSNGNAGISYPVPIVADTYYISGDVGDLRAYVVIKAADGTMSYPHERSFTLDGTEQEVTVFCQVASGATVDATCYPMLNVGTEAKPWEPYTCGGYTDGSQLFDENNLIMINAGEYGFTSPRKGVVLDITGTVTFSQSSSSKIVVYRLYNKDTATLGTSKEISSGFTVTVAANEVLIMHSDASGDWSTVVRGMLNRGSVAKAWQPYTAGMKPVIDIPIETEVGNNLFNEKYTPYVSGLVRNSNGTIKAYAEYPNNRTYYLPITPGETYTVVNNNNSAFLRVATSEVIPADGVVATNTNADTSVSTATITAGANDRYLLIWPRATTGTVSYDNIVSGLVVTVGSTAQPYIKQLLTINKEGGFAGIPVTDASLVNFTDEDGQMYCCDERDWEQEIYVGNIVNPDTAVDNKYQNFNPTKGEFHIGNNTSYWITGLVEVKPGTTYAIDVAHNGGVFYSDENTPISTTNVASAAKTFTTPSDCNYVNFNLSKSGYPFGSNVMIRPVEIDGVPTSASYVPYTDGVFKKMYGADVQRIMVLKSTDFTWVTNSAGGKYSNRYYVDLPSKVTKTLGLSTHFIADAWGTDAGCFGVGESSENNVLYVRLQEGMPKEWLTNNEIKFYMQLVTQIYHHIPEEEAAARRALMANEPATTIISDAPVEVEYATNSVGAMALDNEVRSKENERKIQENEASLEAKIAKLEVENAALVEQVALLGSKVTEIENVLKNVLTKADITDNGDTLVFNWL